METADILEWDERFKTGLECVDTQHLALVTILNQLSREIVSLSDHDHAEHVFHELLEHVSHNFISEQEGWRDYFAEMIEESLLLNLIELSSSFINLSHDEIDSAIELALDKVARFVHVDRAYIFNYNFDNRTFSNLYEWCGEGISSHIQELQNLSMDMLPEWVENHLGGKSVLVEEVALLPQHLKDMLEPQSIKSLVTLPIIDKGRCFGFVGFDAVRERHKFDRGEIRILEIFAALLAHIEDRKQIEIEKKKLQDTLILREEYQRTVLNNFPFLVWLKDREGKFLAVNEYFARIFEDWESEEIIGKTDLDIWPHDLAEAYRADDKSVMENRAITNVEEEVEVNGERRWFETYKSPVIVEGNVMGTVGFARDITNRKSDEFELLDAKNLLSTIIDTMPVRIFWKDRDLNYIGCNTLFANDSGLEKASELIGKNDFQMGWNDQAEQYRADDLKVIKSGQGKLFYEEPQTTPEGKTIWLSTSKVPIRNQENEIIGVVGTYDDITARKEAEFKLELAASVFTHAREGIMITDANANIIDVNKAFTNITGYEKNDILGKKPSILKSGQYSKEFYAHMWEMLLNEGHWFGEIWNRRSDGKAYAQMITISAIFDTDGNVQHFISLFSDITVMKEHERQLEHIAHYDPLTGLANRVLLADRLNRAMVQSLRRKHQLAVAYLDLDGFKEINDSYGHEAGDKLLMAIAFNMKKALREADTLSRLGGDEFVAVLHDLEDIQSSIPSLQRLLKAAFEPVMVGNIKLQVSASLGVTFYPQEEDVEADQLLRQADQAMYHAKQEGKNRFHFFDEQHDKTVRAQHEHLKEVRHALENHEFVLFYQPKVNMRSGALIGAEALIRWEHPTRGLLSPIEFLPLIEDHPISVEVGEWVINQALSQISQWEGAGLKLPVSVNISARQFQESNFVDRLEEFLNNFVNISPSMLELEVLETSALHDTLQMSSIIERCKQMGIKFALDDFGTGYSSLSYLKHLPVSILKIDKSFVHDMLYNPDDLAILKGILGLGDAFRRDVIAEGVENIEQGSMLLQLGCEWAQGYVISPPMRAEKMLEWSQTWRTYPQWEEKL